MRILIYLAALIGFSTTALGQGFSSPSGNIDCYVETWSDSSDKGAMICLIFDADWQLPPDFGDDDPTCDLDITRTVILPPEGPATARLTCHGDVFWPAPLGEISYGTEWSLAQFKCSMNTDGVRCSNASGNTFWVRRAALELD